MSGHAAPTLAVGDPMAGQRIDDFDAVMLSGPDAVAFAQAQFANDVEQATAEQWRFNCWLNPQGRVIVLFLLRRVDPQTLQLMVPFGRGRELIDRLRRFVFRSKVDFLRVQVPTLGGDGPPPPGAAAYGIGTAPPERWIGSTEVDNGHFKDGIEGLLAWRRRDLVDLVPWLAPSLSERFLVQELGLDRLPAYSVKKGCYPGQEIVARMHFRSRAKRHLLAFDGVAGAAQAAPGDALARWLPGHDGVVINSVETAGNCVLLAVVEGEAVTSGNLP